MLTYRLEINNIQDLVLFFAVTNRQLLTINE
jgi:hypothetical protein